MQRPDGISIIICSINRQRCEALLNCIKNTIGVNYEPIIFDNTDKKWGLCKVYNYCAEESVYKYLVFMHEDILFTTNGWGKLLLDFADNTKNCGVIGFAGGTTVEKNFLGWGVNTSDELTMYNYYEAIDSAAIDDGWGGGGYK